MKKISIHSILMVLLLGLSVSACKVAYIPSMSNVPLLSKEGELELNITPANFQGAYSPIEHMGVMINGQMSGNRWGSSSDPEYQARRQFIEGALGYYDKMEEDKIFEVYGGAGYGSIFFSDDLTYDNMDYSANMMRTFVQPSIGITSDYVDVAFSARVLQLRFTNPKHDNYTIDELKNLELYDLDRQPFYFVEPAITFRAGYKFIKAHFQYLYSYKLNSEPINRYNQYFFLGLSLRF